MKTETIVTLEKPRKRHGLRLIVVAIIVLEIISWLQYFYVHNLLEEELEKRAESELIMKGILLHGIFNSTDLTPDELIGSPELAQLGDTLNFRHIYPSSFNILLNQEGQLLAGPPESHAKSGDVSEVIRLINDSSVVRSESSSGRNKVIDFTTKTNHEPASIIYREIRNSPHWQLAVICYDDEVYGRLYGMRFYLMTLMLLAFGILGFILYRFSRNERRLVNAQLEQARINGELHIASNIQAAMLPTMSEAIPDKSPADVFGALYPAKEVGGDLFDYYVRDEKLFFCIGDVSGKGVPASLVMAVMLALFRAISSRDTHPERIMQTLNESACHGNKQNMFVTMFIGILDLPTGRLRYCNAGHEKPLIGTDYLPVVPNIPIGLFPDFSYQAQETILEPDTMLFLYTDGLTEARNKDRELFGRNRVREIMGKYTGKQLPQDLILHIAREVQLFAEKAEQSDDLTMLAIHYVPTEEVPVLDKQIRLINEVAEVARLNSFVKEVTESLKVPTAMGRKLRLAVEEAVVNVIEYAYPIGQQGEINIHITAGRKSIKIVITDNGSAFDPTEANEADTTLSAEDRPIGGLGILLVRELMDSINYERINGQNILTLRKEYVLPDSNISKTN